MCIYIYMYPYICIRIYIYICILHPDTLVVESACLRMKVSFEHRSNRKSCGAGLSKTRDHLSPPGWLSFFSMLVNQGPSNLGGGNSNIFYFYPQPWGRWTNPICRGHIFQLGGEKNHQLGSCLVGWKNLQVKLKDSMAKDEELREELEDVKVWWTHTGFTGELRRWRLWPFFFFIFQVWIFFPKFGTQPANCRFQVGFLSRSNPIISHVIWEVHLIFRHTHGYLIFLQSIERGM